MIRYRTAALALGLLISRDLQGQNLVLNPSFEEGGGGQPTGWVLQSGQGGWEQTGYGSARSVSVTGISSYWRTATGYPVQPGQTYVVRYHGKGSNSQPYGIYAIMEGVGARPMVPVEHWASFSYTSVIPTNVALPNLRIGQSGMTGTYQFDKVEVKQAWPVHTLQGGYTLGVGESLQTNRYLFQTRLKEYRVSNYSPGLHEHTAPFGGYYWDGYWQMNNGQFATYRHTLNGLSFTNATVKATLSYYGDGVLFVEVSPDGQNWQEACRLTPATTGVVNTSVQTNLPTGILPATQIYVRLRSTGQMNVSSYEFQAEVPVQLPEAEGYTWFVEQEASSPGAEPRAMVRTTTNHVLTLALFNTNLVARDLSIDCTVEGPTGTRTSQQIVSIPALTTNDVAVAFPPAGAGENIARVQVRIQGALVFDGSVRMEVSAIQDDAYGYRMPGSPQCAVWWCEAPYKVSRERAVPAATNNAVQIAAARNEYEPFQIMLRPATTLDNLTITVSDFSATASAGTIASTNVEVCRVDYVPVAVPTDYSGITGDHPDPLLPLTGPVSVSAGSNQPFWFTVFVPKDTPPGDYEATVTLQSDTQLLSVPVRLKVYDFSLSDVTHTRSAYSVRVDPNWHKPANRDQEQLTWDLYMQNFRRHRITPYAAHLYAPIDWSVSGGQFTHDFTRFDAAMTRYLDEFGFTGFNLMGVKSPSFPYQLEGYGRFTPGYRERLNRLLGPIMAHLREKGWEDKAYCYWTDEPQPSTYPLVVEGMQAIQQAAPGLRRLLTANADTPLHGSVDIWSPFTMTYDWLPTLQHLQTRQAAGDETWWYVALAPKAPSPNNYIDHPAINHRIRAWLAQRYGVTGDLYWDTTEYTGNDGIERNPWQDPMSMSPGGIILGNGDGMLLYPPVKTPPLSPVISGPINSIRWELIRESMEDGEYFWLLKTLITNATLRLGPQHPSVVEAEAAYQAALDLVPSAKWFNRDPRQLYSARHRIAQAIEQLDDGAPMIVKDPKSQIGWRGSSVTLRSEALGWPMPQYQWQLNGTNMPGETNPTIVLSNLGLTQAGDYRVMASNVFGVVTSQVATLIIQHPSTIDLITSNSRWCYLDQGQEPDTQWHSPGFDDATWNEGEAQLGYGDGDEQTVVSFGADPTNKHITTYFRHTFEMSEGPPPDILTANLIRDDGAVAYLNGTEIFRVNLPSGRVSFSTIALTDIAGSDESAFHAFQIPSGLLRLGTNVLAVEMHQFSRASDDLSFDLVLEGKWVVPPEIIVQPSSLERTYGESAVFIVTARDNTSLNYQWWFNGEPLANETQCSLTLTNLSINQAGLYHTVISNSAGIVTSDAASLTVMQPPSFTLIHPKTQWLYSDPDSEPAGGWQLPEYDDESWDSGLAQLGYGDGDESTILDYGPEIESKHPAAYFRREFELPAGYLQDTAVLRLLSDDGAVVYLNGVEVVRYNMPTGVVAFATPASEPIQGTAESTYVNFNIPTNQFRTGANLLAVEVHQHSPASEDLSFDAQLTGYWQQAPQILEQPTGQVIAPGEDFTLSVSASDTPPLSYQWLLNGQPILHATNSTLLLANLTVADGGDYSVVVSNLFGTSTSAAANLVVLGPQMLWGQPTGDKSGFHLQYLANSAPSTLLVSSNLTDWSVLTDMPAVPGLIDFVDLFDPSIPTRFYRVQFPQQIAPGMIAVVTTDEETGSTLRYWGTGGPSSVEVSSNLVHWAGLTNVASRIGPITVQDHTATGSTYRFYRVRYAPVPAPDALWLQRSPDDPSTLKLQSWSSGAPAVVLKSTDLTHWITHTNLAPGIGLHVMSLNTEQGQPRQFYRVRSEPTGSRLRIQRPNQGDGVLLQYWGSNRMASLLVSTNLVDWQPLGTMPAAAGLVTVSDPHASEDRARFYRLWFD